jgi:hypothetical protein
MRIATKSVERLARDANLPEELIARHMDELCEFVFRVAKRERKFCQNKIKAWYFNKNLGKSPLFDVLNEDDDYDLI